MPRLSVVAVDGLIAAKSLQSCLTLSDPIDVLTIILGSGRFLPILEMWKLRLKEVTSMPRVVWCGRDRARPICFQGTSSLHCFQVEEPGQGQGTARAPRQGGFCPKAD